MFTVYIRINQWISKWGNNTLLMLLLCMVPMFIIDHYSGIEQWHKDSVEQIFAMLSWPIALICFRIPYLFIEHKIK